ncbi:MBL fold metallo-hydrolase [Thermogemmatispora onikobensis]|uniref:MBL fold metallo-hydrolase n=1 Tax=Thermogemmatispora onikobensis TaxID=732234 RepID=UPI0008537896|nr:MBL fold metallo-hydrolase [Thermogemmatispora onikobensis]
MEIVPGIHRQEAYIGKKLMAHHLIVGERSLLVDAGTPELAREVLIPWLAEQLGDPARLDMILVTHGDVDHFGGLETLRAACPRALTLVPALDRRWIEDTEAIFRERYDAYHADHGLTYAPEMTQMLRSWQGKPIPTALGLTGGEDIRCGPELVLQVLHVPGHTPGHLMLWEPRRRVAIIGDALNGATQIDRDGAPTAPPPYTDRDIYLTSIQTIASLQPALLLTGHFPIMRDQEVTTFLQASRDFVLRTDAVLARLLAEATEPLTLARLIELTDPVLGPFGFPPDLEYALEAHMRWLERYGRVRRLQHEGVVAWEAVRD